MGLDRRKIYIIILLVIFTSSILILFTPHLLNLFMGLGGDVGDVVVVDLDTGIRDRFRNFLGRRNLVIFIDNTRDENYRGIVDKVYMLRGIIMDRGFTIIFILSKGDRATLLNYLNSEPEKFTAFRWLHDDRGLIALKLGIKVAQSKMYYVERDTWRIIEIGDASTPDDVIISRLSGI